MMGTQGLALAVRHAVISDHNLVLRLRNSVGSFGVRLLLHASFTEYEINNIVIVFTNQKWLK